MYRQQTGGYRNTLLAIQTGTDSSSSAGDWLQSPSCALGWAQGSLTGIAQPHALAQALSSPDSFDSWGSGCPGLCLTQLTEPSAMFILTPMSRDDPILLIIKEMKVKLYHQILLTHYFLFHLVTISNSILTWSGCWLAAVCCKDPGSSNCCFAKQTASLSLSGAPAGPGGKTKRLLINWQGNN